MALVGLLVLTSCAGGGSTSFSGHNVAQKYSELLTLTQCHFSPNDNSSYTIAEIRNPWGKDTTSILHRYVLVPREKFGESLKSVSDPDLKKKLENLPQGDVIKVPLKKVVVYSSVHASLINEIGGFESICGVCDQKFMYLDKIHKGIKAGRIADCGEGMSPDIEKIMDITPDAILLSPFEDSGTYGKLGKIGIPLVECADYMETSPLGRAEWMRFYGMLFGCENKADSLFASVEKRYNELSEQLNHQSTEPTILTEKKTGDTWYIAGGRSYLGRMIADAGGDYCFNDEMSAGSQPYNPEVVFDKAQNADVWLLKYSQATPLTLTQMAEEWGAYKSFKPFKTHNVWGCNLSVSLFYEETPYHPDLLLKDFVKIFHPELLKGYETRYYKKLKD